MNSTHEWDVTQQMLLGDFSYAEDFNPFHDPKDGKFTSGHGLFNHTNKFTGTISPSYYPVIAKKLGVDIDQARVLADAVNYYTRHSKQFRAYTTNPEQYRAEYGDAAADLEEMRLRHIEEFIDRSPKWSGGRLYRGLEIAEEVYDDFLQNIKAKKQLNLGGTSSWSSSKSVSDTFAGFVRGVDINGPKMSVVLVTNDKSTDLGASVYSLSGHPEEREVLVSEQAHFQPTGKVVDLGNALYV